MGVDKVGSHERCRVCAIIRLRGEKASDAAGEGLADLGRATVTRLVDNIEKEFTGGRNGKNTERGAVVGNPVGAGVEQNRIIDGSAYGEDAGTGSFAGTDAEGRVFNDDAGLRVEMQGGRALEIGLGVGFSMQDVRGSDKVMDVRPEAGGAETDFGERARGGSHYSKPGGGNYGEQLLRAGQGDDVVDLFDFAPLHPAILRHMDGRIGLGKKFTDGSKAGAAVGEMDNVVRIKIVLASPARPDASNGGSGVDEDAVHVDE